MTEAKRPRRAFGEVWRHNALVLLGLSGLAVAQPLLDLFGRNPEFFVAQDASGGNVAWFGVTITLLVPAVLLVLELGAYAISTTVGRGVHRVFVGLLTATLVATVLRHLDVDRVVLVVAAALVVALVVVVLERRWEGLRFGLRLLALAPVLFLAVFLFTSSSSRLIWESEAEVARDVQIGRQAPVVELIFDEFPLSSLLQPDGTINAERFPNFARLADESSWFRNGTAVAWQTEHSVPSILTGVTPAESEIPSSIDHPRNLFTLLGGSYDLHVEEQITDLCPDSVCRPDPAEQAAEDEAATEPANLTDELADAAVVFGHAALPADLRNHLPSVGHSWGDFLDTGEEPTAETVAPDAAATQTGDDGGGQFANFARWEARGVGGQSPPAQGAIVEELIDSAAREGEARLSFAHVVLPHFPWQMTPTGRRYSSRSDTPSFTERSTWPEDEFAVRQAQQQHLLQVGYADTLIGELMDRMQEEGIWDDALVVIVADHGVSFVPGGPQRAPTEGNVDEIYRVPFFIKAPGQEEGETRDDNALLTDILPTTVDALDLEVDWEFDGRSLIADTRPPEDKEVTGGVGPTSIPVGTEGLLELVRRNHETFGGDSSWRGVYAVGPHGDDVGRAVSELPVDGRSDLRFSLDQQDAFDDVDLGSGFVPLLVSGRLQGAGDPLPDDLLVAVNGTVAGVAGGFEPSGDEVAFSALLDESTLRDGANTVELFAPVGDGYEEVAPVERVEYELSGDELVAGDRRITVGDPSEALRLTVDSAFGDRQALAVKGWALDREESRVADAVLLFADGRQIAVAASRDRPDLEETLGDDLPPVGFEAVVPAASVPDGAEIVAVAVFGDRAVQVPVEVETG